MKKALISVLGILATASALHSQPTMDVSAYSRHVWRGQMGPNSISIQPALEMPIGSAGTTAGIWGQYPINSSETEIDFTVSQAIGKIGSITATSYYYDGPFLASDNHDIEVSVQAQYEGFEVQLGRFLNGDAVKDDTWLQVGYDMGPIGVFAGVGDGSYVQEGDGMSLVVIGAQMEIEGGYGAAFIFNADTETPVFVASKTW